MSHCKFCKRKSLWVQKWYHHLHFIMVVTCIFEQKIQFFVCLIVVCAWIKSIIIVPPCLLWVSCIKELSGQRKSHHFHHGGTFALLWGKLSCMHLNIHEWIKISEGPCTLLAMSKVSQSVSPMYSTEKCCQVFPQGELHPYPRLPRGRVFPLVACYLFVCVIGCVVSACKCWWQC